MTKFIPLFAIYLFLQSCVGAGILKTQTEEIIDFHIPEIAEIYFYPLDRSNSTNTDLYTTEWLEAHWGKPETVTHAGIDDLDTIWTYEFGRIWHGILLIVFIPIPIALPLENEKVRFVLRDGCVISVTQCTQQLVGGAFGLTFGAEGDPYFGPFPLH